MEVNGVVESSSDAFGRRVGLIFDGRMCKHYAPGGEDHPECPDRVRVIWDRLNSSGLAKRCVILDAKNAEDNQLALVHTKSHIQLIKTINSRYSKANRQRTAAKFDSVYFNEGSSEAACLSAGSVIEAAEKVAKGELDSAFAIVRPPGHHAEEDEPMGFCLYNNVAIASSFLLNVRKELGIRKILIVDWDVHHGNGTQKMFYNDPRVLFFSVHRHDFGTFYPTGDDGSYIWTGDGDGAGYNINVPWENGGCGDADYLAVWDHILIPIAKEFNPDMIFISAGFDAAIGDPLGGCRVSPYGYSIMLDKLMEFAGGKIVMALEGGYNLNSLANSAQACVEVLLQGKPAFCPLEVYPFASSWRVIQEVRQVLCTYWPVLASKLPDRVINRMSQFEISSLDGEQEKIPNTPKPICGSSQPSETRIKKELNEGLVSELRNELDYVKTVQADKLRALGKHLTAVRMHNSYTLRMARLANHKVSTFKKHIDGRLDKIKKMVSKVNKRTKVLTGKALEQAMVAMLEEALKPKIAAMLEEEALKPKIAAMLEKALKPKIEEMQAEAMLKIEEFQASSESSIKAMFEEMRKKNHTDVRSVLVQQSDKLEQRVNEELKMLREQQEARNRLMESHFVHLQLIAQYIGTDRERFKQCIQYLEEGQIELHDKVG